MLNICSLYALSHDIFFSAAKSACVMFGASKPVNQPALPVTLGDSVIPFVTKAKHLGHILSSDLCDTLDVGDKLGAFFSQVNGFLTVFKSLRCDLKARFFQTYCGSWYGCELWDPVTCRLDRLGVAWRKSIRRLPLRPSS